MIIKAWVCDICGAIASARQADPAGWYQKAGFNPLHDEQGNREGRWKTFHACSEKCDAILSERLKREGACNADV